MNPFDEPNAIVERKLFCKRLQPLKLRPAANDVQLDPIHGLRQTPDDQIGTLVCHQSSKVDKAQVPPGMSNSRTFVKAVQHTAVDRVDKLLLSASGHEQ